MPGRAINPSKILADGRTHAKLKERVFLREKEKGERKREKGEEGERDREEPLQNYNGLPHSEGW